jgi:hypothetical protein
VTLPPDPAEDEPMEGSCEPAFASTVPVVATLISVSLVEAPEVN